LVQAILEFNSALCGCQDPAIAEISPIKQLSNLLNSAFYAGPAIASSARMWRVTVFRWLRCLPQFAILALVLSFMVEAATQKVKSIPVPGTKAFPESVTSTSGGALFVGRLGDGGIVRVNPRTAESTVFVKPGASGSRSILGVFADDATSTLWACSNDLSGLGGPATGGDPGSALSV
jgi:hypothetical protein